MPAIGTQTGRSADAERVIRKKKRAHPRGQQGPISSRSHSQPGIITDREYEVIEKRKAKAKQRVAIRKARTQGGQGRRGTSPAPDSHDTERGRELSDKAIKKARIRYLRRTRKPPTTIKAELEGRGLLAKALNAVAQARGDESAKLVPGTPNSPKMRSALPSSAKVASNLASDFVNFPAQAVPSLYVPAAGAVEAAQGRPERLKRLARDINESDPIFNAAAAVVEKVKGNDQAASERFDRAVSAAAEHPGFAAIEALGVKGAVGRGAGSLARSPVAPKRIRRLASTEREARVLEGTGLRQEREYSPDLGRKAAQVAGEKLRRKIRRGRDDDQVTGREVRRRVDEAYGTAQELQRNRTAKADDVDSITMHDLAETIAVRDFGVSHVSELPQLARDRLARHRDVSTKHPLVQVGNRAFREAVLTTSPSWLAGNLVEGVARAAVQRAGPRSYVTGKRVLRKLEDLSPKAAEEALARLVGGGHAASIRRQRVSMEGAFDGTNLAGVANALHKFWQYPGPKHAASLWHHTTEFVFRSVSGRIESNIQTAMLGRELRRSSLMDQHMVKLSDKAITEAAEGLTKTANQVRFARKLEDSFGRYNNFSPGLRQSIATVTPFAAWALSAANFVMRVLPRDHPAVTGLIAAMEQAADEWLQDEGLGPMVEGALPSWLQGSIPTGDEGRQRISRYTPFAAFGSPTETAASQVLPQIQGIVAAFNGQRWNGSALRVEGPDGKTRPANEIEKAVAAAHSFLGSFLPLFGTTERVVTKGPGTLNPFRDVEDSSDRKASGSAASVRRRVRRPTKFFHDDSVLDLGGQGSGDHVLPESFFKDRGGRFFQNSGGGRVLDLGGG
jgi:hypothetical protein